MKILVNGLQRTGTNYTLALLQNNTPYKVTNISTNYWKHEKVKPYSKPSNDKIVTVIKNPYTWVESICFRNPVDVIKYWDEYQLKDNSDYLGQWGINLTRLMLLYKDWYSGWIEETNSTLVHYEDLLTPRDIKRWLIDNLDVYTPNIIVKNSVPQSLNFNPKIIPSYKNYNLKYLTPSHICTVNEILGKEFILQLGYNLK